VRAPGPGARIGAEDAGTRDVGRDADGNVEPGPRAVAVVQPHEWGYRGQVIPTNQVMTVEAVATAADDQRKLLRFDGFQLVDGRVIYAMKNFTVCQTRGG
jgi:hypothetical protein